ncbi:ferredoxin reductase family protein [Microvirga sp. G4-2]|uniref:ferredoxin reductase family protein n=1 Tax=Microvirga sp. G4-2 TaxID=3434467 RepID=UPI004043D865
MGHIKIAFWGALALLAALWLLADPLALQPAGFFALRGSMVQLSGVLAMGCMSLAMILALRPRWPERWLGGLDKMYRLHKWLGIGGLVLAVAHWLWSQGPKWAVGLGWLERPARGAKPVVDNALQQLLLTQRGTAEGVGEWAFYATVLLIVVALVRWIPYRLFYKTHRLIAVAYLVLVFHSVVLMQFSSWATPLGLLTAGLLAWGTVAAVLVLFRRIGTGRKVEGRISRLRYYPELRVLEGEIDIPEGWPGHKAGQFAFLSGDPSDGPHPYTIASAWDPAEHRLTFITKELGDFTRTLRAKRYVGEPVTVEGPYGCLTFADDCPRQIWVGGGIGITPFIARMKQIARERQAKPDPSRTREIHLFHPTADYSDEAITKLRADAEAAGVHLHVLHDKRDGRLTGERIRAAVPGWREASLWFCGPAGFGEALRRDFARQGLKVAKRFHQELFAMR